MSAIRLEKSESGFCLRLILCSLLVLFDSLAHAPVSLGQEQAGGLNPGARLQVESVHSQAVTPLPDLLAEAERNNPQVQAARQAWQAAQQVPTQVSTLPDPQFTVQHFSVGSPRPFAGYTNADVATISLACTRLGTLTDRVHQLNF